MKKFIPPILLSCLVGAGCAVPAAVTKEPVRDVSAMLPADAILVGEQHDAPEHQRIHREVIDALAARGVLAAVAIEMAPQGGSTAGLPRDAGEAEVQAALNWKDQSWPWASYGPAVMAAVRSGVPVLGGNLPRAAMRGAMNQDELDLLLPAPALQAQQQAIRQGHCEMLPESQVAPMTRVQIARDRTMAQTLTASAARGKTVVLLAGGRHVDRQLGVPAHLPPDWRVKIVSLRAGGDSDQHEGESRAADAVWTTPPVPPKDYCSGKRARFASPEPPLTRHERTPQN